MEKVKELILQAEEAVNRRRIVLGGRTLECFAALEEIEALKKGLTLVVTGGEAPEFCSDEGGDIRKTLSRFKELTDWEELYIKSSGDGTEFYADSPLSGPAVKQIPGFDDPLSGVNETLQPLMREGFLYSSQAMIDGRGGYTLGTSFDGLPSDGEGTGDCLDFFEASYTLFRRQLNRLYRSFPPGKITRIYGEKGKGLRSEVLGAEQLLEEIGANYRRQLKGEMAQELEHRVSFKRVLLHRRAGGEPPFKCKIEGFRLNGGKKEALRFVSERIYQYLYPALEEAVREMKILTTKERTLFYADKALPELGIALFSPEQETAPCSPFLPSKRDRDIRDSLKELPPDSSLWTPAQAEAYHSNLRALEEALRPKLKEGREYVFELFVTAEGHGRERVESNFYAYKDGIKDSRELIFMLKEENEEIFERLRWFFPSFPGGKKTKVRMDKGGALRIEQAGPVELIADIKAHFFADIIDQVPLGEDQKILVKIREPEEAKEDPWLHTKLDYEGFLVQDGDVRYLDYSPHWGRLRDYEALYLYLEKGFKEMTLEVGREEVRFFADRAFPQWGIEKGV